MHGDLLLYSVNHISYAVQAAEMEISKGNIGRKTVLI